MAPSAVHDLKTLVLSRHPGILIETHEPERAEALIQAVAGDLRLGRFEWSVTTGLRRAGDGNGVYQTTNPGRALAEMRATVPLSVTRAEDVRKLRSSARGRFVPVR